ncbi:MAG: hypothetical protein EOL87_12105 [Spartobacteria bacterium]|nr:hypothetical protein [Spartobacteria bacterium]
MAFDNGAVSFRMFFHPTPLPDDAIERFKRHAAPPLETVGMGVIRGWVTGRHLLDRNITEETATKGYYTYLCLQEAERKIPPSLLEAECKIEELAIMAAEDRSFVSRRERSEIKKMVTERLLPDMPPQLKGFHFVYHPKSTMLLTTAVANKQAENFGISYLHTTGVQILHFTADLAAYERSHVDPMEWLPVSFSPEVPHEEMELVPGRDFLTWLWFCAEARGGLFPLPSGETPAVMVEGPLNLCHEGNGAHDMTLKNGLPAASTEAKAALMSGKKLKNAKITLVCGDESWNFGFNADEFSFRSMKLPKITEHMEPDELFNERMRQIERLLELFLSIFDIYTLERRDVKQWKATVQDMQNWVKNREGRR